MAPKKASAPALDPIVEGAVRLCSLAGEYGAALTSEQMEQLSGACQGELTTDEAVTVFKSAKIYRSTGQPAGGENGARFIEALTELRLAAGTGTGTLYPTRIEEQTE